MQRIVENWLIQIQANRIEPSTNPSFAEGSFAITQLTKAPHPQSSGTPWKAPAKELAGGQ